MALAFQRIQAGFASTHASLSSMWRCRANLNPSLIITAVSSDWTEGVLLVACWHQHFHRLERRTLYPPCFFYAFVYKTALHCSVQKRIIFFPHNLSRWIISDLFWATVEGGNRKPEVREYLPQLIWQLLSHHAGCLHSYYIFIIQINVCKAVKYLTYINKDTHDTVTHCRTVLSSMLKKMRAQSESKDGHEARKSWHLLRDSGEIES